MSGRTALVSANTSEAGIKIRRGPNKALKKTTKQPLNIVAMFKAVGSQRRLVDTKPKCAAEIRQPHADKTRVHRREGCAQEYADNSDVGIGSEFRLRWDCSSHE